MAKRKNKKQSISNNKSVYFSLVAAIIFSILIIIILNANDNTIVVLKNIAFEHEDDKVYVTFDIKNPLNHTKECSYSINVANREYTGDITAKPKSKQSYKLLVDMPDGKTEVSLNYKCL